MKLVIDISEEDYNKLSYSKEEFITLNCSLREIIANGTPLKKGYWKRMSDLSEDEDDRYECSHCGNVVHHKNKMNLYTFNSWCGRCGSNNGR